MILCGTRGINNRPVGPMHARAPHQPRATLRTPVHLAWSPLSAYRPSLPPTGSAAPGFRWVSPLLSLRPPDNSVPHSDIRERIVVTVVSCRSPATTTKPLPHKPRNGPSSELTSRVHHIVQLLVNLPETLPLDPERLNYAFSLDMGLVGKEGIWYTFNRNLDRC